MIHFNTFFSPKSQPGNTTKEAFEGPVEGCTVGSGLERLHGFMEKCEHHFRSQHLVCQVFSVSLKPFFSFTPASQIS